MHYHRRILRHRERAKKKNLTSILSLIAIVISLISVSVSICLYNVAKSEYRLKLQPNLSISLIEKYGHNKQNDQYFIELVNDGPVTISDIRIFAFSRGIDLNNPSIFFGTSRGVPWKVVDELEVDSIKIFSIDEKLIHDALEVCKYDSSFVGGKKIFRPLSPFVTLQISYYKYPERRKFNHNKYLMIITSKDQESISVFDIESSPFLGGKALYNALEKKIQ